MVELYISSLPFPSLSFPSFPSAPFPFPPFFSLPLEVGPLNPAKGVWGSAVSSPSRVWGEAPAEIEFGEFKH